MTPASESWQHPDKLRYSNWHCHRLTSTLSFELSEQSSTRLLGALRAMVLLFLTWPPEGSTSTTTPLVDTSCVFFGRAQSSTGSGSAVFSCDWQLRWQTLPGAGAGGFGVIWSLTLHSGWPHDQHVFLLSTTETLGVDNIAWFMCTCCSLLITLSLSMLLCLEAAWQPPRWGSGSTVAHSQSLLVLTAPEWLNHSVLWDPCVEQSQISTILFSLWQRGVSGRARGEDLERPAASLNMVASVMLEQPAKLRWCNLAPHSLVPSLQHKNTATSLSI